MKKTVKKPTKSAKKTAKKSGKLTSLYATEHDFIIIAGGGLIVLMLTVFLFLQ